jgi:hypothetical protein
MHPSNIAASIGILTLPFSGRLLNVNVQDWWYLGFPTKRAVFVRLDRVLYARATPLVLYTLLQVGHDSESTGQSDP